MANLIPCPSCGNKVSNLAASCPSCGHPFRSAQVNVGYNAWDYVGLGICALSVAVFLVGCFQGSKAGPYFVTALAGVVVGLLCQAVGRVLAGSGKK
jgi:hypothetical protein